MNEPTERAALDAEAVGRLLGCSGHHVRRMAKRGDFIPPVKLGALVRWDRASVLRWLAGTGGKAERGGVLVETR